MAKRRKLTVEEMVAALADSSDEDIGNENYEHDDDFETESDFVAATVTHYNAILCSKCLTLQCKIVIRKL